MDVGANIGLLTLVGAQAVGHSGLVWAFEPNPRTFIMLEKNVTLSGYEQIKIFPIALGSENSTAKIEFVPYHKGGATLIPGHGGPQKEDVKLQTLDSMIKQEQTRRIKLIKVDVEGWEYEFVKGAERILVEHSPILMLEYIKAHNGYYGATGEEMLLNLKKLRPDYRVFFPRLGASRVSKLMELKTSSDLPAQNNLWFLPREYWDYADKQG